MDDLVLGGMEIIDRAVKYIDPKVRIRRLIVNYPDIYDEESSRDFLKTVFTTLVNMVNSEDTDEIFINIAGGRKTMVVICTLTAMFIRPSRVFHVINKRVALYNDMLVRLENKIRMFSMMKTENEKNEYFSKHRDEFLRLLYPPLKDLSVIEIPLIPYPRDYIEVLVKVLEGSLSPEDVDKYRMYLSELERSGLIEKRRVREGFILKLGERGMWYKDIIVRSGGYDEK
jgi:hypothetical protein